MCITLFIIPFQIITEESQYVIRKNLDGVEFGPINVIESDEARGYCYPAIFKTCDNSLLLAYCRGNTTLDGGILNNTAINKIPIADIE